MKTEILPGGATAYRYMEYSPPGFIVVTLIPTGDGSFKSYREYHNDRTAADTVYAKTDMSTRIDKLRDNTSAYTADGTPTGDK